MSGYADDIAVRLQRIADGALEHLADARTVLEAVRTIRDLHAQLALTRAEADAARQIAEQWNVEARAEGFGGGSQKGKEIIAAMDATAAKGGQYEN